jgi:hypothetical protein
MKRFIRIKATTGNCVMVNTRYIQTVVANPDGTGCVVYVAGGVESDDFYEVDYSMDEIQAAIEGEIELVPRQPVQQPKRDDGEFRI